MNKYQWQHRRRQRHMDRDVMQAFRPNKKRRYFSANTMLFIGGTLIIIAGLILIFVAGLTKIHS